MLDEYRVRGGRGVQVVARQLAALTGFGVVVLEPDDPISGGRLGRALANRLLNVGNRAKIAIHPAQVPDARIRRVRVRIDETRHDGLAADIDLTRTGLRQAA